MSAKSTKGRIGPAGYRFLFIFFGLPIMVGLFGLYKAHEERNDIAAAQPAMSEKVSGWTRKIVATAGPEDGLKVSVVVLTDQGTYSKITLIGDAAKVVAKGASGSAPLYVTAFADNSGLSGTVELRGL